MALTLRQLNRATLARQLLLERARLPVTDAVRRIVAVQAQEPASPYLAMWNRTDFDPADLDGAFTDGEIVKATLMRITLHGVHVTDYTAFHEAMVANLRASRVNDRRFTSTGLTAADADALVEPLVSLTTNPRTVDEIEGGFEELLGAPPHPRIWWALRTFAPIIHSPVGGPWSFRGSRTFAAGPSVPPRPDPDTALRHLFHRYLDGFGPASAKDFSQFSLQKMSDIRRVLPVLEPDLVEFEGPNGERLFDHPDAVRPRADTPAPARLMAMWDSILLAHHDRSRVIPPGYRKLVIRSNGDVLPTLLVDGFVAGVWRVVDDGVEATAFHELSDDAWDGLDNEARRLIRFIADRDPQVYRRYQRWWDRLPAGDVRVLGG